MGQDLCADRLPWWESVLSDNQSRTEKQEMHGERTWRVEAALPERCIRIRQILHGVNAVFSETPDCSIAVLKY